jgi:drug/metabolite transporter (DMT)-like permease
MSQLESASNALYWVGVVACVVCAVVFSAGCAIRKRRRQRRRAIKQALIEAQHAAEAANKIKELLGMLRFCGGCSLCPELTSGVFSAILLLLALVLNIPREISA